MNTETMKRIAELAYPDSNIHLFRSTLGLKEMQVRQDGWVFEPHNNQKQELKLIRMYREWLQCEVAYFTMDTDKALMKALESTETLLEAIERDML